jgi:hypothetical protein
MINGIPRKQRLEIPKMFIGPCDHLLYLITFGDPPIVYVIDLHPSSSSLSTAVTRDRDHTTTPSFRLVRTFNLGEDSYLGVDVSIANSIQVIYKVCKNIVYV